jgi:hypothetical protein
MSEEMFGGRTRSSILETLATAKKPLAAYSIAKSNNLDVKTTYDTLDRLASIGIVEPVTKANKQTAFKLADDDIRKAIKTLTESTNTINFDTWMRPNVLGKRLMKLASVRMPPELADKPLSADAVNRILSLRVQGELEALIKASRSSFNKMFKQLDGQFVSEK